MVPTVERGLWEVDFCSIEMAGDKPSIWSMLKGLLESVDFENEESFVAKVNTVKESYFSKEIPEQIEESVSEDADEEVEVSSSMNNYLDALRKTSKK